MENIARETSRGWRKRAKREESWRVSDQGGSGRSGQDCAIIKSGILRRGRLTSIEAEGQCPGVGPAAAVNLTVSGSARNRATFRGEQRAGVARNLDIPARMKSPTTTPLVNPDPDRHRSNAIFKSLLPQDLSGLPQVSPVKPRWFLPWPCHIRPGRPTPKPPTVNPLVGASPSRHVTSVSQTRTIPTEALPRRSLQHRYTRRKDTDGWR